MPRRHLEYVRLDSIVPALRNPKRHDQQGLAESFDRLSMVEVITEDDRTGRLVSGHGRVDQLRARYEAGQPLPDGIDADDDGMWLVPVVRGWASADDNEADAAVVAVNELVIRGGFDAQELAQVLDNLTHTSQGLTGTGYVEQDYAALLESLQQPVPAGNPEPDEPDEPPADPVTQRGDVWLCGPHRLMCGDSTSDDDVDHLLAGDRVDYTFTSPPYGIDLEYEREVGFPALVALIAAVIRTVHRVSAPKAYATMNYADVFLPGEQGFTDLHPHYSGPFQALGWHLRGNRVWAKPLGRLSLSYATSTTLNLREWEYVRTWRNFTTKEKLRAHGQSIRGIWQTFGDDAVVDDWRQYDDTTGKDTHPAAFPVVLPVVGLRVYTDRGAVVLDPFGGSGTVMVACHHLDRRARLMELDPRYCDVTAKRWQRLTGELPVLERTGEPHDFLAA